MGPKPLPQEFERRIREGFLTRKQASRVEKRSTYGHGQYSIGPMNKGRGGPSICHGHERRQRNDETRRTRNLRTPSAGRRSRVHVSRARAFVWGGAARRRVPVALYVRRLRTRKGQDRSVNKR